MPPDRWTGSLKHDGIKNRLQLRNIMPIGSGHDERQRDATPVHQQMALAPIFSPDPWGWVRYLQAGLLFRELAVSGLVVNVTGQEGCCDSGCE